MARVTELDINVEATIDNIRNIVDAATYSLGCTKKAIAKHMGVEANTLYNWLNGVAMPGIEDLAYLCSMGDVGLEDVIVRNYEVNHSTLKEQRMCFQQLVNKTMNKIRPQKEAEESEEDSIQLSIIAQEWEKLKSEVVTLNEAMMFFSIMDDEAIHYLKNSLRFVGNTDSDRKYIWKQFSFVINHLMSDDDAKEYYQNEINLCTHNPYILRTLESNMDYKQKMVKNYWSTTMEQHLDGKEWWEGKFDTNYRMQCLMDTFEKVWSHYQELSFVEFIKMIMPSAADDWSFGDRDLLGALMEYEEKINSDGDEEASAIVKGVINEG